MLREVLLAPEATIAAALAEVRTRLADVPQVSLIDWEGSEVGVWGVRCGREAIPADGDRVELYRPLPDDPRQRRRLRARARRR